MRLFLLLLVLSTEYCYGFEKLDSKYLITYGDTEAKVQVVQYFSFRCPHCLSLFKNDFHPIKKHYVDTEKILLIFHPVPMDLLTVQAMACLEKLSEEKKKIFFEGIFEFMTLEYLSNGEEILKKAMEVLKEPIPLLNQQEYLTKTAAFQNAFLFLKQEKVIQAVPTVEVNNVIFSDELPTREFLEKKIGEAHAKLSI